MRTWTHKDRFEERATWPPGAWDDEPDKALWIFEGLDCQIVRNFQGALCGYVGVPEGHPFWEGDDHAETNCDCHGGVTFAGFCQQPTSGEEAAFDEEAHICLIPSRRRVWWLGFDCAHCFDIVPGMSVSFLSPSGRYRDFAYVKAEVEALATQLFRYAKDAG